ncbi:MAG: ABC transporter substrate-binding protein [Nakamurella sp.]
MGAAVLGAGLVTACSTTGAAGSDSTNQSSSGGAAASAPGVTPTTITLGALLALTGTFAAGAKAQLAGAQLYWNDINANGGVCDGRTVKITARDHEYDPQKAVTAYSDIHDDILGIQLLTGTPMTEAVADQMAQETVSAIPMSWSPDLLGKDSILVPGTTYDIDMVNAVDYLVKDGTLADGNSIGYVYFQGDFGGPGLKGAEFAAKKHNITVKSFQVDPSVTDLSSQVSEMAKDGVKAIFMSVSPPMLANAAAVSHTQGLDVPIVVPSPTYVPELLSSSAAEQVAARVMVVSSYNAWTADTPGLQKLRDQYKKSGEKSDPQQFFIAGYAAASMMHAALDSACSKGALTRESLKDAFANVKSFAMDGLSVDLSYHDRKAPASLSDYILHADKDAVGGLKPVTDTPFQGEDAQAFLASK